MDSFAHRNAIAVRDDLTEALSYSHTRTIT